MAPTPASLPDIFNLDPLRAWASEPKAARGTTPQRIAAQNILTSMLMTCDKQTGTSSLSDHLQMTADDQDTLIAAGVKPSRKINHAEIGRLVNEFHLGKTPSAVNHK